MAMRGHWLRIVPNALAHHAAQAFVWMGPTLLVFGLILHAWAVAAVGALIFFFGRYPLVRIQDPNRYAHYEEANIVIDEHGISLEGEPAMKLADIREAVIMPNGSDRPSVRIYGEDDLMAQLEVEVASYDQAQEMLRALGCSADEKPASFRTLTPRALAVVRILGWLPLLLLLPILFRHVNWNKPITAKDPFLQSMMVMALGLAAVHLPRRVTVYPDGIATTFFGRFRRFYSFADVTKTTHLSRGGSFEFKNGVTLQLRAGTSAPLEGERGYDALIERALDAYDAYRARIDESR
jgi:hypothetical protein